MSTLVEVTCARCGSARRTPAFRIRDWQIVDCEDCRLRYLSPRWPDSAYAAIYDADYYKSPDSIARGYEDYAADRESILRTFRRRFGAIARHVRPGFSGGRYLDVGCAYGFALDVAAEQGMQAFGVDVSPHAVAKGRERGLAVEVGGADAAERAFGGGLRVASSWDVIEHLPDPVGHLEALARLLEPGGVLSLITPDRGSLTARFFGARWVEYQKPEEHILFFRREDIGALLARTGFEVLAFGTAGKYVTVGFALERLAAYGGPFALPAKLAAPLGGRTVYVDPFDKMHVLARRVGR